MIDNNPDAANKIQTTLLALELFPSLHSIQYINNNGVDCILVRVCCASVGHKEHYLLAPIKIPTKFTDITDAVKQHKQRHLASVHNVADYRKD